MEGADKHSSKAIRQYKGSHLAEVVTKNGVSAGIKLKNAGEFFL